MNLTTIPHDVRWSTIQKILNDNFAKVFNELCRQSVLEHRYYDEVSDAIQHFKEIGYTPQDGEMILAGTPFPGTIHRYDPLYSAFVDTGETLDINVDLTQYVSNEDLSTLLENLRESFNTDLTNISNALKTETDTRRQIYIGDLGSMSGVSSENFISSLRDAIEDLTGAKTTFGTYSFSINAANSKQMLTQTKCGNSIHLIIEGSLLANILNDNNSTIDSTTSRVPTIVEASVKDKVWYHKSTRISDVFDEELFFEENGDPSSLSSQSYSSAQIIAIAQILNRKIKNLTPQRVESEEVMEAMIQSGQYDENQIYYVAEE